MKIQKWILLIVVYVILFGLFMYSHALYNEKYDTIILLFWVVGLSAYTIAEMRKTVSEATHLENMPTAEDIIKSMNPTPIPIPLSAPSPMGKPKLYSQLEHYVIDKRNEDFTLVQIGQSLVNQGYTPELVNEMFTNLLNTGAIKLDNPVIDGTVQKKKQGRPKKK